MKQRRNRVEGSPRQGANLAAGLTVTLEPSAYCGTKLGERIDFDSYQFQCTSLNRVQFENLFLI